MSLLPWIAGAVGLGGVTNVLGAASVASQPILDAVGANQDRIQGERAWEKNAALQREFAQHGIRWRMEDAKAAGLHPLAALGAAGASASPISVGGPSYQDLGRSMGQDISRAVSSMSPRNERVGQMASLQLRSAELDVQGREIQNAIALATLAKMKAGTGPGLPSNSGMPALTGQGDSPSYVVEKPLERTHSAPGRPAQEVGHVSDYGFARTSTGLTVVPSKDVKERIEDQFVPELMWSMRNSLAPNLGAMPAPSTKDFPIPDDFRRAGSTHWKWNPLRQEFQPNKVVDAMVPWY